jgi:hypothetical protein
MVSFVLVDPRVATSGVITSRPLAHKGPARHSCAYAARLSDFQLDYWALSRDQGCLVFHNHHLSHYVNVILNELIYAARASKDDFLKEISLSKP